MVQSLSLPHNLGFDSGRPLWSSDVYVPFVVPKQKPSSRVVFSQLPESLHHPCILSNVDCCDFQLATQRTPCRFVMSPSGPEILSTFGSSGFRGDVLHRCGPRPINAACPATDEAKGRIETVFMITLRGL